MYVSIREGVKKPIVFFLLIFSICISKDPKWLMLLIKEKKLSKGKYLEKFQYFKKISGKLSKVLTDTLAKFSQNIFAYFSVSSFSLEIFFLLLAI